MSDRLTIATIDLDNYAHNISEMRILLPETVHIMAVVKANAYGHGLEETARAATTAGATFLGVVSLGELKRIRLAGITTPTLLLNYLDSPSIEEAVALDASVTITDETTLTALEAAARLHNKEVAVHIKIDTGMHRAGCNPNELLSLAKLTVSSLHLKLEGCFTHFAESESTDITFTQRQLQVFKDSIATLREAGIQPPLIHCANSAAIIAFPDTHFTMVRPGLVSYGLNPFPKDHPKYGFVETHFKPVLSLKTQIVYIRRIDVGETVGYNRQWCAQRPSTVALLPVGYGDGYRRTPHNAGKVLVHGFYAPIVGSVAMDQTVVDITDIVDKVSVGDEVVLLGTKQDRSLTADDLALAYGTINYEVTTALSDRIVRIYSTAKKNQ